jgi:hypothetical protein
VNQEFTPSWNTNSRISGKNKTKPAVAVVVVVVPYQSSNTNAAQIAGPRVWAKSLRRSLDLQETARVDPGG